MTLIVVTIFAAQQEHTVHTLGQGIFDPDDIDRSQTSNRNEANIRRIFEPVQCRDIQSRIGVVLADQTQNAQGRLIIIVFRRHADGLDHGSDAVDAVVDKINDSLGTASHASTTAAAAGRVGLGSALGIVVNGPEGTFLGAAFALGAALEEKVRKRHIAGTRVNGDPAIDRLEALNGF